MLKRLKAWARILKDPERVRRTSLSLATAVTIHTAVIGACALFTWEIAEPRHEQVMLVRPPAVAEAPVEASRLTPVDADAPRKPLEDVDLGMADSDPLIPNPSSKEAGPGSTGDAYGAPDGDPTLPVMRGNPDSGAVSPGSLAMEADLLQGTSGIRTVRGLSGEGTGTEERWGSWRTPSEITRRGIIYGGGKKTEDAVRLALEWLARHQSPGGAWESADFTAQCQGPQRCTGLGRDEFDVGVTGLTLEAFLAHGYTHQDGKYKETVRKGLHWLRKIQQPDGQFGPRTERTMYNQALATLAVADAYGMTRDAALREAAERGARYLVKSRNAGLGWRYLNYHAARNRVEQGGENDTSVIGWVIMALKVAKEVGDGWVPSECFDGANAWLDQVRDEQDGKTTYGYTAKNAFVDRIPYTTTAAGMIIRQFTGAAREARLQPELKGARLLLSSHLPQWGKISHSVNLYEWYYAALALFQEGGSAWRMYNTAMVRALLEGQSREGETKGSWDPAPDRWGADYAGRVYTTACATLCLEVYYRYNVVSNSSDSPE